MGEPFRVAAVLFTMGIYWGLASFAQAIAVTCQNCPGIVRPLSSV